jgi:Protein of unknown function (DUF5672)
LKVVLVTPTHKDRLTAVEKKRLQLSLSLNRKIKHLFYIPSNIEVKYESDFPDSEFIKFNPEYFSSYESYNRFCLNKDFYLRLRKYDALILLQTDALLVRPFEFSQLKEFDYVGAPWIPPIVTSEIIGRTFLRKSLLSFGKIRELHVGNGGLSWRKIETMLNVVEFFNSERGKRLFERFGQLVLNEDAIIAYAGALGIVKIPQPLVAKKFFLENLKNLEEESELPFGFHALEKSDRDFERVLLQQIEQRSLRRG